MNKAVVVDLNQTGTLLPYLDEQTVLFHLAGPVGIAESVANPNAFFRDNVELTLNVLDAVRDTGARMVFASTGSVYSPLAGPVYCETSPLGPVSPYGASKLAVEIYASAYNVSYGTDVRIARMFSVYGPGMKRMAMYDFARRLAAEPNKLVIRGDGTQTRDLIHVCDACAGLSLVALTGTQGETYNIATGQARTTLEVAEAVAAVLGEPDCEVTADGQVEKTELGHMRADVSKIKELGFEPSVDFQDGVAETLASFCDTQLGKFVSNRPVPGRTTVTDECG